MPSYFDKWIFGTDCYYWKLDHKVDDAVGVSSMAYNVHSSKQTRIIQQNSFNLGKHED